MSKLFCLLLSCIFISAVSRAATGDTTIITAHTLTNLNSPPSNDDVWVVFPNNKSWQRIIMKFTLGCGTPNCSGWDYTVNTSLGKKTGTMDSTVASVDTLTNDTTWSYFEHVEYIEAGRLITPYGTYMANNQQGFDRNWTQPYYYDVTDYATFLKDSVSVRVHYDGWSDAFSASVDFIMIEGTPERTVENVTKVYDSYIGYGSSAGFESVAIPKSFIIAPNVESAKVIVIMTGHGMQGEFDPHSFYIKVNDSLVYSKLLWKGNCGMNAVAPQGGTWLYNRANWCPGEKVPIYEVDITPYITPGTVATINLDFDDFQPTDAAGYGTSVHLVTYTSHKNNDVMLEEIIAPNSDKPYLRFNPISTHPIVKIRNEGSAALTYAEISYWVKGGGKWYYEWTGNLPPYESEIVTLPAFDWNSDDSLNTTFIAEANWPNNQQDEYIYNNHLESQFALTPVLDSVFFIQLKTNDHPEENWYVVKNENGDTITYKTNLAATTIYRDTLHLQPGSYALDLYDYDQGLEGGDGLSWWVNLQNHFETGGTLLLRKMVSGTIKNFNPDFGNNIHYEFTVGYPLGKNPAKTPPEPPVHPNSIHELPVAATMTVFPNPATEVLNIKIDLSKPLKGKIFLSDISGKVISQFDYYALSETFTLSTKALSKGMYFLSFVSDETRIDKKIILQ